MAGYVVVLVAFPTYLNFWTVPRIGDIDYHYVNLLETLHYTLSGALPDNLTVDAVSRASPLDAVKAGLSTMHTFAEIDANPMMGNFGGRGWEWISNFILLGGIWLLMKKVIRWHIPLGVFAGLLVPSIVMYAIESGANASPGFYLFSGATMLCAFFVATDPVSAATSPKGRLIYGAGIGFLIYAIRRWGSYADGVAFAVIIMNMAAPAIDHFTKPRIVGHIRRETEPGR
jgi:electron transport complex protein RnfD